VAAEQLAEFVGEDGRVSFAAKGHLVRVTIEGASD